MSVAVDSNKKSPIVYINDELCRPRKISITDMTLPNSFNHPSVVVFDGEIHVLGLYHLKWDGTEWVPQYPPTISVEEIDELFNNF
jgi:hypothetical protein